MSDALSDFVDAMIAAGLAPADRSEIIDDDKPHRYRVDGDKPKTRNGSYALRVEPDGFAFGWFMSFREGVTHKWHSKAARSLSPEEKAAHKAKLAAARRDRDAKIKAEAEAAAARAVRLWARLKPGVNPYLDRKQVEAHGARVMREMLVVPMRTGADIVGLQFIAPDGTKRFLTGSAKDGAYFSIAKKGDDLGRIVICEGFATGATLRQATGWPVIVAFDAGNLAPVAKAIRAKYPDAQIIIAGDNDIWTRRQNGEDWNPGVEKAQQAAVLIGGARVLVPQVDPQDPDRPTDWNDIHCRDGLAAVTAAMTAAPVMHYDDPRDHDEADYPAPAAATDPMTAIRPLGHNRGIYYFFPRQAGQIVALSATGMSKIQNLYMLAPRDFWTDHYGGAETSDTKICAFASAHLMQACHGVGIFEPDSSRGVGAWIDRGELAVNCGDVVLYQGHAFDPSDFQGEAVYESGPRVIDLSHEPLCNREAVKLREICRMLNWRRGMYADLLAGWLVIAAVGSALPWRPHIWITGRTGAGKSTVLDEIVKPVLGTVAIRRDGGTTEAGVRKALGTSGRPYILDEAESETQVDRINMERIIFLARRSSSGGVVENFNASFQARSCFCFSAINPRVEQNADKGRITQIELMSDVSVDRDERFDRLMSRINSTITGDFGQRLLARTIANMDALLANVRTFSLAASGIIGNKRSGDQIGPMLAGAYALTSTGVISFEAAREWMLSQDWEWTSPGDDDADSNKLLTHIMTARVRFDVVGLSRESSIGEMVALASDPGVDGHGAASRGLKPYGIKVDGARVLIANKSPQLRRILSDTPWIPWMRTLGDLPGADNFDGKAVYFAPGLNSKCMSIPLSAVIGDGTDDVEEEIPIEYEEDAWR